MQELNVLQYDYKSNSWDEALSKIKELLNDDDPIAIYSEKPIDNSDFRTNVDQYITILIDYTLVDKSYENHLYRKAECIINVIRYALSSVNIDLNSTEALEAVCNSNPRICEINSDDHIYFVKSQKEYMKYFIAGKEGVLCT